MKITIKKGDTLWSLALQHLGNGLRWTFLYDVNRATIHKAQRGQTRMIGPDWIFPGTVHGLGAVLMSFLGGTSGMMMLRESMVHPNQLPGALVFLWIGSSLANF